MGNQREQLIHSLLEAEQSAKTNIDRCQQEASRLLDQTSEQIRKIRTNTKSRLGNIRSRCNTVIKQEQEVLKNRYQEKQILQLDDAYIHKLADKLVSQLLE